MKSLRISRKTAVAGFPASSLWFPAVLGSDQLLQWPWPQELMLSAPPPVILGNMANLLFGFIIASTSS